MEESGQIWYNPFDYPDRRRDAMRLFETDENQVERIEGMTVEYPYCLHERDLTDLVIPWHWHEELELGYIQEGASKIVTIGAEYTIRQGDGFFINSNVMDMKRNGMPGAKTLEVNHVFHPVFLSGHFKSRFETKYLNPVIKNRHIEVYVIRHGRPSSDRILKNLRQLKELQYRPDAEFQTRSLLSETWLLLLEELRSDPGSRPQTGAEQQDRMRSMIAFIHRHYAEKLSLSEIAKTAGVSEREASRCFRKSIGQSPVEYLIAFRLNESKKLLRESGLSITEIGLQCGFSSGAYFGKLFRAAYGVTPGAYRSDGRLCISSAEGEDAAQQL